MERLSHLRPESAFIPTSRESRELEQRKELEMIIDPASGKIVKVGDPRDVEAWMSAEKARRPSLEFDRYEGGVALPGFTDTHNHLLYATLEVIEAGGVWGATKKEQILKMFRDQTKSGDQKLPKVVLGYNTQAVPNAELSRADFDQANNERASCLIDLSFHGGFVNTKMLELLLPQIEEAKRMGRRITGHVDSKSGHITEGCAILAIQIAESYYGVERIAEGMETKVESWIAQGITNIHDMYPLSYADLIATLIARKSWQQKRGTEFPVRQIFMVPEILSDLFENLALLEKQGLFDRARDLPLLGLKLLADGSFGSHTAMLSKPYAGTENRGIEYHSVEEINRAIEQAKTLGLNRIAMHAIGDEAVRRAVETAKKWRKLAESAKLDPGKFRIEHCEMAAGLGKEISTVGAWVSSQPNFLTDFVYRDRLEGRVTQLCPHAEFLENGVQMMFGSDGMPSSALFGIWAATHHSVPGQRISLEQALAAYSLMTADYEHESGHGTHGRLLEGSPADIVVVNRDTFGKLLQGEGTPEEFAGLAPDAAQKAKVQDLEAGIARIYRHGRQVR